MNKININEMGAIITTYLTLKHPSKSNGFIIRLGDIIDNAYNRRRCYTIQFPFIQEDKENNILKITDQLVMYILDNYIDNYDLTYQFTILSIDPIIINKNITEIFIQYSGEMVNPEDIIRSISSDIITQMNKHIIELYMDNMYPDIDISDSKQLTQFNEIFNQIEMDTIFNKYPNVEVNVPINLTKSNDETKLLIYINGTIKTTSQIIDIIDDIRNCLDTDDTTEIFKYIKEDIVYNFSTTKEYQTFNIITYPNLSHMSI